PAPLRRLRSDQPALVRRWTETVAGHTAATAGRGDRVPRPAGVGTTAAPRLVTARSPASEAVEAAPSGGFQPADRHPDGSPGSLPLPRVAEATGPTTMAVAVHGRDPVGAPGTRRALPDVADIARSDGSRRSGAIPGPAPRRPSDGSVSPAAAVRRSTQPAPVSTWTSAAPTALLTAHTVASWSHP